MTDKDGQQPILSHAEQIAQASRAWDESRIGITNNPDRVLTPLSASRRELFEQISGETKEIITEVEQARRICDDSTQDGPTPTTGITPTYGRMTSNGFMYVPSTRNFQAFKEWAASLTEEEKADMAAFYTAEFFRTLAESARTVPQMSDEDIAKAKEIMEAWEPRSENTPQDPSL